MREWHSHRRGINRRKQDTDAIHQYGAYRGIGRIEYRLRRRKLLSAARFVWLRLFRWQEFRAIVRSGLSGFLFCLRVGLSLLWRYSYKQKHS